MTIAALSAPPGYQLIEIDIDNVVSGDIESLISAPRIVIGFVIRLQEGIYFSILPVTIDKVYDDGGTGQYALIRPDGKIEYCRSGYNTFNLLSELKYHLLWDAAECWREMAQDCRERGERKEAASFSRYARKLKNEAEMYS